MTMKIRMTVQDGSKSFEFEHAGPAVTVGRNPAGELVLEEDATESVVSWEHVRINLSPREATLTDLRSTNGTYRNGSAVNGTVPLWPKDVVRLGQTGPTLTVEVIDLTPAAAVPRLASTPRPAMIPIEIPSVQPATATKPRTGKAAAPVISETRGIALKAVQNLMAQQEELRVQQAAQTRHRRALAVTAIVALLLFLLLGGGLLVYSDKLRSHGEQIGELKTGQEKLTDDVAALGANVRKLADETADHFAKVDQDLAAGREKQDKTQEAVRAVLAEEARVRGGIDQLKKDLGASLDDLNRKLTLKPAERANQQQPPRAAANGKKPGPRIEPGMKVDAIMKDGSNYYKGVLLGIDGTHVRLQTLPYPDAKPSEFDIRQVQAFQTRDGIFAYNEATGEFVSAITYFKLNKASGMFERTDDQLDPYRCEDAQVLGQMTVRALWGWGPDGGRVLGLPGAGSQSPPPMEAKYLAEVVTAKGIYTFDQSTMDYTFKPYSQLAAEAKVKRDEYWDKVDEKQWQRRKESYQLVTDRLHALWPYFWRRWW
jgi:pSer/pThr/pTyr-binding forkhead associated (FHA) protein